MASKRKRAKATKPHAQARSGPSSRAPVVPAMTQGVANLKLNSGDVTKGAWKENPDSLLMRLPREVRERIYALLLTSRMSAADQKKHTFLSKKPNSRRKTLALDVLQEQTAILPGSTAEYSFIASSLGLLLTCKQLHAEANAYLFSSNTFTVMPESGREHCFWSCNGASCRPDIPCLVHVRNIVQIKHLYVLVNNPHAFEDRAQGYAAKRLKANVAAMARCLKELGVKLLTLKVRYLSCMIGQIEERRKEFDAEPKDEEEREIIVRSPYGDKKYTFGAGQDHAILFQNTRVLDKLKVLRGIAESVTIVGDLPTSYVTELTDLLSVAPENEEDSELTELEDEVQLDGYDADSSTTMAEEAPAMQHSQQGDEDPEAMAIDKQPKPRPSQQDGAVPPATATQEPERPPPTGQGRIDSQIRPAQEQAEAQRARQSQTDEDRAAFFLKLSKQHPGDTEMKELCSKIMRGPNYSPAVMEQLFAPPSKKELKRFRATQKKKR